METFEIILSTTLVLWGIPVTIDIVTYIIDDFRTMYNEESKL